VLTITGELRDAIVAHARRDHPDEACGVIAGPTGSDRPERLVEMTNAARSPTYFELDSAELLALDRDIDRRDEDLVVIYHSHTATEAYPSRTDRSYMEWNPDAHWVLTSTREADTEEFRSFRLVDGEVVEEPVQLIASYDDAPAPSPAESPAC
jgi:proteasome lid subunit RPN8/RPN11